MSWLLLSCKLEHLMKETIVTGICCMTMASASVTINCINCYHENTLRFKMRFGFIVRKYEIFAIQCPVGLLTFSALIRISVLTRPAVRLHIRAVAPPSYEKFPESTKVSTLL
jgi:hypothetical protein